MKRPVDLRTAARDWRLVLSVAYPLLRQRGVGDLVLFGSNALSLYLKNPLKSKDLDFVSSQIGPSHLETLAEALAATPGIEVRSTTIQSKPLQQGMMRTYSIELRINGKPFFVEIFDKVLDGRPPSILAEQVRKVRKWGVELWAPSLEAVVVLRLAFRRPEGISRLNATRLNRLIRENRRKLKVRTIRRLIQEWGATRTVTENLNDLHKTHRLTILNAKDFLESTGPLLGGEVVGKQTYKEILHELDNLRKKWR